MDRSKNKKEKEDENMAIAVKPNEATIIRKDMLTSFLNELRTKKVTEEYWKECAASRELFSSSDIDMMKKMCDGDKN